MKVFTFFIVENKKISRVAVILTPQSNLFIGHSRGIYNGRTVDSDSLDIWIAGINLTGKQLQKLTYLHIAVIYHIVSEINAAAVTQYLCRIICAIHLAVRSSGILCRICKNLFLHSGCIPW